MNRRANVGHGTERCRHLLLAGVSVLTMTAVVSSVDAAPADGGPRPGPGAAQFFERLKALEGRWHGASTKGWEDRVELRTIAGGSVVMSLSLDAHPGETMVTMYHLDGERLLLTHYCVARNQPRLVATEFAEDGLGATFTFLDATGIPSRDSGHMDQLVVRIEDDRRFTSRWTWYAKGEERWLEEIRHTRLDGPGSAAPGD